MKYLLLSLLVFTLYAAAIGNTFVWDDEEQVVNNQAIHSISNWKYFFRGSTFQTGGAGTLGGIYYKPLMSLNFSGIYSLCGPTASCFHFFQIGVHILNVLMVFWIYKHFFREKLAFVLATIFAIHPINVESVVYVSALQDALFMFWGLFGFICLIKLLRNTEAPNKISELCLWGALLFSLLSKETGAIFLAIGFGYTWIYGKRYVFRYVTWLGCLLGIYLVLRLGIAQVPFASQHLSPITRVNVTARFMTMPKIFYFYLTTYLFPRNLAIAQHWIVEKIDIQNFTVPLVALSILGGLLAALFRASRAHDKSKRQLLFFTWWFFVGMSVHSQLFPLDMTVADRWFYAVQIGLLGIGGVTTEMILAKRRVHGKSFILVMLAVLFLLLSMRTIDRIHDWKNGLTLFRRDINISTGSFDLQNNLGVELFRIGDMDGAKKYFMLSTETAPYWWTNWNNFGAVLQREGQIDAAENAYQKAVDNGDYYLAWENLASIKVLKGDSQGAEQCITEGLKRLPFNDNLLSTMALLKQKTGNDSEALFYAQSAYNINPSQKNGYILQKISNREKID